MARNTESSLHQEHRTATWGRTAAPTMKTARVDALVLLRQQDYDQKTTDAYLSLSSRHVNARRAKMLPWNKKKRKREGRKKKPS